MNQFSQQKRTDIEERSFQYPVYEQVFLENDHKRDRRPHTGERSIQSNVCKRTFFNTSILIRQMPNHSRKKTHQCNLCGKTFSQKFQLGAHMRKHTGEKALQCVVCEQRFSQETTLNRHMRTHTGEKPFQCAVCDDRFSQKSSLNRQMRKHTGQKHFSGIKFGKVYPNRVWNSRTEFRSNFFTVAKRKERYISNIMFRFIDGRLS
ncbi:hypothetical protein TNIN_300681 [Trichonephila inaurata madagascariensis]|uniref:C2H2-type domain-containing protein n=1 Tax=Trichonephila inaurata madagascariensis TaxID=2747483 RepID=A0A8X6WQ57_9ARAC|nr:hypothetical protein TNIN_300681 [Trichonephila inaurata madagascariensis]